MEEIRYILVDTCIWIDYLKSDYKRKIINNIVRGATLCTNQLIDFELEIGLRKIDEKTTWDTKDFNLNPLPVSADIFKELNLYKTSLKKCDHNVTPSATDAIIGSQILKFKSSKLMLLTANHKDFPTSIFERVETYWVEGEKPYTYCLYRAK